MSTRGIWGLRLGGEDRLLYIPAEAAPHQTFGQRLVPALTASTKTLHHCFKTLSLIPQHDLHQPHTLNQDDTHTICGTQWRSTTVLSDLLTTTGTLKKRTASWGTLLYGLNADYYLQPGNVPRPAVAAEDFHFDSASCHYGYILNLDSGELEFYLGNNQNPRSQGRYAAKQTTFFQHHPEHRNFGITLCAALPLSQLRKQPTQALTQLIQLTKSHSNHVQHLKQSLHYAQAWEHAWS